MPTTTFDPDTSPDLILDSLERDGYAIIRDVADRETIATLNDEFDPYINNVQLGQTEFAGHRTRRINNLVPKSPTCQQLVMHPLILGLCDHVLLPNCARYHLHLTLLVELQPGEVAQGLHRDGTIYPVRLPTIPLTLATMWACDDFTRENGGTQLVPGSHRWPHEREPEPHEVINAEMPSGSVLVYTSNLIHGGGENRSTGRRRGMALHYNLGWLRQEENQYLSVPPEKAAGIPNEVLKLMGYDFGGPYLGFVENGHPLTLADPSLPHDMDRTGGTEIVRRRAAVKPIRIVDPTSVPDE